MSDSEFGIVSADLAVIDKYAQEVGAEFNLKWRWLLVEREGHKALVPVSPALLPARAGDGHWLMILHDVWEAFRTVPMAEFPTDFRGLALHDDSRALEMLHDGHFKPEQTPGGLIVEVSRLFARNVARL